MMTQKHCQAGQMILHHNHRYMWNDRWRYITISVGQNNLHAI